MQIDKKANATPIELTSRSPPSIAAARDERRSKTSASSRALTRISKVQGRHARHMGTMVGLVGWMSDGCPRAIKCNRFSTAADAFESEAQTPTERPGLRHNFHWAWPRRKVVS